MKFWILCFLGVGIFLVTTIIAIKICNPIEDGGYEHIEDKSKFVQVIMNLLTIISIVLGGGVSNGIFLSNIGSEDTRIWVYILAEIIPAFITYVIFYFLLYYFSRTFSQICFIVVFIISIIGWTISINNYNRNIEKITETTITSTQERKLIYFCNIPVQEISGNISSVGIGRISGSISTSDELSYWYLDKSNQGIHDSATASSSRIVFISDEEKPYLEIISHCTYTKTINHNNGEEDTTTDKEWNEYIFYLPEAIMQYTIE